jgi:hypothetical protein
VITFLLGWLGNIAITAGLWGIGNRRRGAFWFSMVGEAAWIVKSVAAGMWDLAFICCVFFALAVRSYIKWNKNL